MGLAADIRRVSRATRRGARDQAGHADRVAREPATAVRRRPTVSVPTVFGGSTSGRRPPSQTPRANRSRTATRANRSAAQGKKGARQVARIARSVEAGGRVPRGYVRIQNPSDGRPIYIPQSLVPNRLRDREALFRSIVATVAAGTPQPTQRGGAQRRAVAYPEFDLFGGGPGAMPGQTPAAPKGCATTNPSSRRAPSASPNAHTRRTS